MTLSGCLTKMPATLAEKINYELQVGSQKVPLNPYVGQPVHLTYSGRIFCTNCGRQTQKSFFQGFCYPCFISAPQAAECILHPELCRAHEGKGRDIAWEREHHLKPHYVYLAASSGVKVGVTSETQIPTRWIDQGASSAIIFAETPNRYLAGAIEVHLKQFMSDKTPWQRMLKNEIIEADLLELKAETLTRLPPELAQYGAKNSKVTQLNYPVIEYPTKVKSIVLDKVPEVRGTLNGIKGQYWLLNDNRVINIRRHTGYEVTCSLIRGHD